MESVGGCGEIREEMESPGAGQAMEERVFVALGKDVKVHKETLIWALRNVRGKKVCILHVHQPAQMIPMEMGAKFPASKVKPKEVKQYREQEKEKMQQILDEYVHICAKEGVPADKLFIEMDDIEKGILQLVVENGITDMVMGTAAHKNYSKKMREPKSKKALFVGREAPLSCHISFVCKGTLVCTRKASLDGTRVWATPPSPISSPSTNDGVSIQSNVRSASHKQVGTPNRLKSLIDMLTRSKSEGFATNGVGVGLATPLALNEMEALPVPMPVEGSDDQLEGMSKRSDSRGSVVLSRLPSEEGIGSSISFFVERNTRSEDGSMLTPVNEDSHFTSTLNVQEESVVNQQAYEQLEQAMAEGEIFRREALEELIKRQKTEKDAIKAKLKAKSLENLYANQKKQREELEKVLSREMQERDKVKMQQEGVLEELQRAHEQQSDLEIQVTNSHHIVKESEDKLSEAQQLLNGLQRERDELQWQCNEAIREVEELQRRNEEASTSFHRLPDFSEFSLLEVEEATNGFDPSLKIGGGGYGTVYKGILRHTAVAIKVLQPESRQGPSEFQQEVDVLSRVRHPNLVKLIGTCPEAWSLLYEYLPNGSLEDRLACKDNTPPLSWQTRIRILADVCSALIFLHSNKPQGIVHGDLKPANILLDANYVSKLGDFGICRLISQNDSITTHCCITDAKGTPPYMDPEFISIGVLTPRSDVYSFGIIILRLLTGKPALRIIREVQLALQAGNLHDILDESAGDWPFLQAKRLAHLALRCCETNRKSRPDLESEVWKVLEPMRALSGLSSSFRTNDPGQMPSYSICPIFMAMVHCWQKAKLWLLKAQKIMQDPHVAADGFTYEAEAFRGWIASGHENSPTTNARLAHKELIPNRALKSAIEDWLQQQ